MRRALLAFGLVVATACGGARAAFRADTAEFPVSLSDGLRRSDGSLVAGNEMQQVGRFEFHAVDWTGLFTLFPWRYTHDLSSEINRQVSGARGDGIVDLAIAVTQCPHDWFSFGLLPSCALFEVTGSIVSVLARPPIDALPVTASPPAPTRHPVTTK